MNFLQTTTASPQPLTMSSKEIAELLDARHDNVKRTIERMADRGVIEFPPSEEIPTATKPVEVYNLDKRSSLIVVAQLSPEFTARVVDRWQELEAQVAKPVAAIPQNFGEALRWLNLNCQVRSHNSGQHKTCSALRPGSPSKISAQWGNISSQGVQ
jgi:phage regulator Rha-like protein